MQEVVKLDREMLRRVGASQLQRLRPGTALLNKWRACIPLYRWTVVVLAGSPVRHLQDVITCSFILCSYLF
jgi:hypothetical protein